jgi:hypothetical protein
MQKNNISITDALELDSISRLRILSKYIARFAILLSMAIFAPMLGTQALTGTIVNATLFISTVLLGFGGAVLIGVIPSSVSVLTGLLPGAIAPMVPFIIFSNIILISFFIVFKKKSYWKGVAIASFVKFGFLYVISSFVVQSFVSEKVASNIALMMSWPQLFTAISGGILAYFVLGTIKRFEK